MESVGKAEPFRTVLRQGRGQYASAASKRSQSSCNFESGSFFIWSVTFADLGA